MFPDLAWWGYALYALPAVAGFALGARWMRDRLLGRQPQHHGAVMPVPSADREDRVLEAIDALRREISELAERQDFAERLLAQRSQAPHAEEAHTPV